jgi:hypothetical protein
MSCAVFYQCTKTKKEDIERSQYMIYQNKVQIENNYEIYRRRQAIVEHPMVWSKDNGAFIKLWPRKPLNTPLPMWSLQLTICVEFLI